MEVRLYITEGDIEDHHVFREKLSLSGLSWRETDLEDADAVIILAGLWGTMKEKIMDDVKGPKTLQAHNNREALWP